MGNDNVKDYPPYLDYPKPYKTMTNADKLRSMSDEELAEWLDEVHDFGGCPNRGAVNCQSECRQCWLDWLRQEARDGET